MSVIFMGTPAFAVPALRALHEAGHTIAAVYTQPPRPAGRGQKETPSPVHQHAAAHGLPVFIPVSLKSAEVQAQFAAHGADVAVVAAYGLILPKAILQAPARGCLNIHPSLLPRWRGAAPIPRALMAGDEETGVCIMQMDEGLDTGPVLLSERFPIPLEMDAGGLHDALAEMGARMMLRALAEPGLAPVLQSAEGIAYAAKITKEDCRIDWRRSAEEILCQIRALSPVPGAFGEYHGEKIKIFSACCEPLATPHASLPPGTVLLNDALTVACGRGALRLETVQRSGKNRMRAEEMLKGFPIPPGSVLA